MATETSLEDVKKIDQRTKDCVFGFIRKSQTLLPDNNVYFLIPSLVIHWILLYFNSIERFAVFSNKFEASKDNTIVTKTDTGYSAAYLTETVSSGIHYWRFKVLEYRSPSCTFHIGIWKSKFTL